VKINFCDGTGVGVPAEGSVVLSSGNLAVDKETTSPVADVLPVGLSVSFGALTSLVGWQEGNSAHKKTVPLVPVGFLQ